MGFYICLTDENDEILTIDIPECGATWLEWDQA